jgi:hypothetical protein
VRSRRHLASSTQSPIEQEARRASKTTQLYQDFCACARPREKQSRPEDDISMAWPICHDSRGRYRTAVASSLAVERELAKPQMSWTRTSCPEAHERGPMRHMVACTLKHLTTRHAGLRLSRSHVGDEEGTGTSPWADFIPPTGVCCVENTAGRLNHFRDARNTPGHTV